MFDVLVADRRELPPHFVGMIAGRRVDHPLDAIRVPGHDELQRAIHKRMITASMGGQWRNSAPSRAP